MRKIKIIVITCLLINSTYLFSQSENIEKLNKKELRLQLDNAFTEIDSVQKINLKRGLIISELEEQNKHQLENLSKTQLEIITLNELLKIEKINTESLLKKNDSIINVLKNYKTENITSGENLNNTLTDDFILNPKSEKSLTFKLAIDKIVIKDNLNVGNHSGYYESENGESYYVNEQENESEVYLTKIFESNNYHFCYPKSFQANKRKQYKSENDFLFFKSLDLLSEKLPIFTIYKSKFLNLKYSNKTDDLQINISEIKTSENKKFITIKIDNNKNNEKISLNIHSINNENYLVLNMEHLYYFGIDIRNHKNGYIINNGSVNRGLKFDEINTGNYNANDLDEISNYFLLEQPKNNFKDIKWINPKEILFLVKMIEIK